MHVFAATVFQFEPWSSCLWMAASNFTHQEDQHANVLSLPCAHDNKRYPWVNQVLRSLLSKCFLIPSCVLGSAGGAPCGGGLKQNKKWGKKFKQSFAPLSLGWSVTHPQDISASLDHHAVSLLEPRNAAWPREREEEEGWKQTGRTVRKDAGAAWSSGRKARW